MSLIVLFDSDGVGGGTIPTISILDINVYANNLVRILFDDEFVTDVGYNDPTNYTISVASGTGPVEVLSVLPTNKNAALEVVLVTQPMTAGTVYTLDVGLLTSRAYNSGTGTGYTYSFSGLFEARYTKLDSSLRSIPKHFDKRPESILHTLLTATSISDDLIGGSRSDSITYS
jgi:hypothetical protein